MPIPTDTFRNTKRLNIVFAVTSAIGLASLMWMMWHDYSRDWRKVQTGYFNLRSALAHFTALSYESPEEKEKHDALKKAVADAKEELDAPETKSEIESLEREVAELKGKHEGVALAYGNMNAELGVTLFMYDEEKMIHGPEHPKTVELKKKYEADTEAVAAKKVEKDDLEDALREKKGMLKRFYAERNAAQKKLAAYEKGLNDAKNRDAMFGPGLVRGTLNFPIIEYAPPKGVPGRQEVKQVFMPSVRFDFNFIDSYVTDRCITCHVSIDDPVFSKKNFVKQAKAALETDRVRNILRDGNEKLVRKMAGRLAAQDTSDFADAVLAPTEDGTETDVRRKYINLFVHAANVLLNDIDRPGVKTKNILKSVKGKALDRGTLQSAIELEFRSILAAAAPRPEDNPDGKPLDYAAMSREQREDYFKSLSAAMNLYLDHEGRPTVDFSEVYSAHPRLDLFVSPNSPHPMKKMGCTVCHEGSGQETDFVLAAHTPKSHDEKEEWKEKYYDTEAGLPLATFHTVEEFWERPMLQPKYVSASCAKCHDQIYDLERYHTEPLPEADNIVKGRELFTRVGCINCHNVDGLTGARQVGTDLTHVADKLSTGFMERWIEYPAEFRPSTRMPHFFRQENNLNSSAHEGESFDNHPEIRTEAEVKAIAHYLEVFSRPYAALSLPEGIEGNPERGEELFRSIGCLACHVNLDARDPLDDEGRTFGQKWIVADIAHEKAKAKADERQDKPSGTDRQALLDESLTEAKAAYEEMSQNERVRYAVRRFTRERRDEAMTVKKTETFLADIEQRDPDPFKLYVPPEFVRHGPELSGIGTKLVPDQEDTKQIEHANRWLYSWFKDPRHYSSYTVMPRMFRENYYQDLPPEERVLKNDQDMMDMAAYLLTLRHDTFDPKPIESTPEHDSEMKRLILQLLGGQNTEKVAKKILNDEKMDPSEPYGPLTRSIVAQTYRSFGGGDDGRQKVAALIRSKSDSLHDRQQLFFGMKMIAHYGCFSCHKIAGFEDSTPVGTDLSLWAQKFLSQLDFAYYSHVFEHEREEKDKKEKFAYIYRPEDEYKHLRRDVSEESRHLSEGSGELTPQEILHNHAAFAYHKMRNPRIYDRDKIKKPYEKLKMPNFFLTEKEARALTTYLLSRRAANVREDIKVNYQDTDVGRIARGRALAHELNCIGCHTIEGNREAAIHQYYSTDKSVDDNFPYGPRFKPPLLWGEGAKIQHAWLFNFLNNVEMLRPWLNARMPSFYLDTEDATTLVEYFAGLSQYESGLLEEKMTPVVKYLKQVHAEGDSAAETHWFADEKLADSAAFFKRYALAHNQVGQYDFDTSYARTEAEEAETLAPTFTKIMNRSRFLSSAFDADYPFAESGVRPFSEERFKLGEELFYEQGCLACHVAGDPSVPGTSEVILAPNFALTSKRLSRDWVYNWVHDPQAIQPGANMPQIFPDGKSAFATFGDEEARKEKEAKYGKTNREQADLLLDFIYWLGERNYTAIQPGGAEKTQEKTQEGDVEFDFDSEGSEGEEEEAVEFDFE
ncbi:MAG: c-type cytochrome [Phycisphaerales bacterium]|nr:c-type cytochrome [Phycisphaerales bacterium]